MPVYMVLEFLRHQQVHRKKVTKPHQGLVNQLFSEMENGSTSKWLD
jgi:hypothetical protein